jgi:tetratricopeptide (TPR) repeat protein
MRNQQKLRAAPLAVARQTHLLAMALLVGLALLAYTNSFQSGFVLDNSLLLGDPRLKAVGIENLKLIFQHSYWWPSGEYGLYRPISSLSYLMNFSVLGNESRPFGYHLVNYLLHAANACLVYRLAFLLLEGVWPAFFTAALWAVHPVATESVTNIVGRADELAGMAVVGGLLLYIRSTAEQGRRRLPWLGAVMLVTTLGVFSKESAVAVAGAAALYDLTYRLRQVRENPAGAAAGYAVFVPPLVAMWLARAWVFAHSAPAEWHFLDNPLFHAGFLAARFTAIKVIGKYLWLLAWPRALSCDRSYNQIPVTDWRDWGTIGALVAVAGLLGVAAWCYFRQTEGEPSGRSRPKAVFFFIGFSFLMLMPTANLFVLIGTIMAERFLYLPAIGFAGCLVVAVYAAGSRFHWRPFAAPALLSVLAAVFGLRTYVRNGDWKDEETLWRSATAVAPQSFKAHFGLAIVLNGQGPARMDETIAELEKAVAIVDGAPNAQNATAPFYALGTTYLGKGEQTAGPERMEWYRKSLRTLLRCVSVDRAANASPTPGIYSDLGLAYLRTGDPQKALETLFYARRLAPRDPMVYRRIATSYSAAGENEKIAPALMEALILDDSPQSVRRVLSAYDKAAPQSCAAIQKGTERSLNPDCPLVRRDLCTAYQDLTEAYRDAKSPELANRTADIARQQYGCAPAP